MGWRVLIRIALRSGYKLLHAVTECAIVEQYGSGITVSGHYNFSLLLVS